jgi:hypothetical protein
MLFAALLALLARPAAALADIDTPITERKVLDSTAFPASRPPLPDFRTWEDVESASCTVVPNTGGALLLRVVHKPIPNITPDMLAWLYEEGLRKSSVIDGVRFPNFLRMHPRDHAVGAGVCVAC